MDRFVSGHTTHRYDTAQVTNDTVGEILNITKEWKDDFDNTMKQVDELDTKLNERVDTEVNDIHQRYDEMKEYYDRNHVNISYLIHLLPIIHKLLVSLPIRIINHFMKLYVFQLAKYDSTSIHAVNGCIYKIMILRIEAADSSERKLLYHDQMKRFWEHYRKEDVRLYRKVNHIKHLSDMDIV